MICPYVEEIITTTTIRLTDDDDIERADIQTTRTHLMQCQKENCAVWRNGKCNYKE